MGWWSEELKGKELTIGDEPLDVVGEMFDKLVSAYAGDVGRKPTPDELAKTLEIVLSARLGEVLNDIEGKELAGIAIRLKKRLLTTYKATAGDHFAVPLPHGGYGYGRIEDVVLKTLLLVQFLAIASHDLLSIARVIDAPPLFECACSSTGLVSGEWIVIGNDRSRCQNYEGTEKERGNAFLNRLTSAHGHPRAAEMLEERLNRIRRV